jgi:hypothetical protein
MWASIILGAYAALAGMLLVWAARVAFCPTTKPAVRDVAFKVFRLVWSTGIASGGTATALKLHDAGFL